MKSAIAATLASVFLFVLSSTLPAHAASDEARAAGLLAAGDENPALRCRRLQQAAQTLVANKGYDSLRAGSERRIAKKPRRMVRKLVGSAYKRGEVSNGCYRCVARQIVRRVPIEEQLACGLHDPCVTGCALDPQLDPCAAEVCESKVDCCTSAWDQDCVSAAATECDLQCEACSHDVCQIGFALDPSCSTCAATICETDPFCCDTLWSDECVGKVQVVCGIDCLATTTTTTVAGGTTTTTLGGDTTTTVSGATTTTIEGATTTLVGGATTTTLPPGQCVETIDFNEPPPGTIVTQIETTQGTIVVKGTNPKLGTSVNAALLFDSTCSREDGDRIAGREDDECTGGDTDLGSPNEDFGGPGEGTGGAQGQPGENDTSLGNILIIASDLLDKNGNGLVDDPDDQAVRRVLYEFDFSAFAPVSVLGMTVVDVDADDPVHTPSHVELFDGIGASLGKFPLPETGNNGVAELDLPPNQGVWKLVVSIKGSSAIDNLRIACPGGTTTTVPASTTTTIGGGTTTTVPATTSTTVPASTTTTLPATTTTVGGSTTTVPDTTTTVPDTTTTVPETTTTVPETTTTTAPEPTTTSTSTTTTSSTTSTTVPVLGFECDVTFGITSTHTGIGALQFEVLYGGVVGGFKGEQFGVACTSNVGGNLFDDDAAKKLSQSTISSGGFDAPLATATCTFETNTDSLAPDDFQFNLIAASDLQLNEITPALAVTAVECAPAVDPTLECTLRVDVSNATDVLTALQISTSYGGAPAGGFPKNPCTLGPAGGVTDVNNDKTAEKLTIGYANNGSTFAGPNLFASCKYRSTDGDTPAVADFPIALDDASEGAPIPTPASPVPTLSLTVQSCAEVDPACGNGIVEGGETCDDGNVAGGDGCNAACTGA